MKPAIAYGLIGSPYSRLRVMTITSEQTGRGARVYGRDQRGRATSASVGACYGRYATIEEAEAARAAVQQVFDHHGPLIAEATERLNTARAQRKYAVDDALVNIRVAPVEALEPVSP